MSFSNHDRAMKFFRPFLASLIFSATASVAFAVATTNAAPATPAPAPKDSGNKKEAAAPGAPVPATVPAAAAPVAAPQTTGLKLDDYIKELADELKLSNPEKAQIQADYVNDGPALQKILNDDLLSPLQKTQQVDQLRDVRNNKIEMLLVDLDRRQAFREIEAKYRAALIDPAADGEFAAAPPAPAPAAKS
jgi:hypothetical protein